MNIVYDISSDISAIRLVAISDDLHWLACSDCTQTIRMYSFKKMKVCQHYYKMVYHFGCCQFRG